MSIADPIQIRKTVIEVALKSGSDPVPSATLTNAIHVDEESNIVLDQAESNSQANIAKASMSKSSPITGRVGGTSTISGNVESTDGVNPPSAENAMLISGMAASASTLITLTATATNVAEGDTIDGVTSGAQGIVKVVDDTYIIVDSITGGPFQAGEPLEVAAVSVGTVDTLSGQSYQYVPDSDSTQVGSVFVYKDGIRRALKDCAGNLVINANTGGFGTFEFNIIGKYDETNWGDAAIPDTTYPDVEPPVFKCSQMKLEFEGGEYIPINSTIEYNFGATPVMRTNSVDCTGYVGAFVSSRADAGGSMQVEVDQLANFDADDLKIRNVPITLSYRLGDGTLSGTIYVRQTIVITEVATSPTDGIEMWDLTFEAIGDNDDESYLVFI